MSKDPFTIIKNVHVTEKTEVLKTLKDAESNPSLRRCKSPKYVFVVDKNANKQEIASAIEDIYRDDSVKVTDVNTINVKGKKRRVRGRIGMRSSFKKAVVTLREGDQIGNL
ncbi:MAG: 50S ribosomal protein L23 [Waddliaceae bacterium]